MLERRAMNHSRIRPISVASFRKCRLVISDIGLPDRSGYELEELRATKGWRDCDQRIE